MSTREKDLIERFKRNSAGVPYGSLFKEEGIEPLAPMNADRLATEA
jgi:hypothetical protein